MAVFLSCTPKQPAHPPKATLENPFEFLDRRPDSSFQEAYAAYQQGDQAKARTEFMKLLQKSPDDSAMQLAVAYTYLADADAGSAESYTRKALDLNPDYAQAHFLLASLYESKQDYDNALKELDEVNRINPTYPGAQQSRNILRIKGTEAHINEAHRLAESDPAAALHHYKLAEQLAPEITQVKVDIANLLLKQKNCTDALPYLHAVIEDNPDLKLPLADCLVELRQNDEALQIYEQLREANPDDPDLQSKIKETEKTIAISKLPDEYQQISTTSELSRAQLAALLAMNLEVLEKYNPPSTQIIVDILNHWAAPFIQKMVELQIMDSFPNRTFQPSQPLTKVELAKAASRIVEILANEGKTIPENQQATDIPDVPISNIYYPMISKVLSAGVLTLDADGRFHPSRPVSGAEALSMVNHLKSLSE